LKLAFGVNTGHHQLCSCCTADRSGKQSGTANLLVLLLLLMVRLVQDKIPPELCTTTSLRVYLVILSQVDDDDQDADGAMDDEVANLTAALEKEQQLQSQAGAGALKAAKEVRINTGDGGSVDEESGGKKPPRKHGWDDEAVSDDEEQQRGRSRSKNRKNADDNELLMQPPAALAPTKKSSAWKKTVKTILGLSGSSMKVNGKKLTPNLMSVLLFMVSSRMLGYQTCTCCVMELLTYDRAD
jgi:hypothetical protein